MKRDFLSILHCPHCKHPLAVKALEENDVEIRRGRLACTSNPTHTFEIEDGIVRFATGFDREAVQKEIAYENSTYSGDERLTDPAVVAQFPDTLPELWPHVEHFGPDFRDLIDHLDVSPESWVLDVGTAACWSCRLLAQRGARVIALDVNDANFYGLKTADILFEAHDIYFERLLESMTHLPFREGSISFITFNASLHHTPDLEVTLRECHRVLKPGGIVAVVNEEFASVRQRLLKHDTQCDGGSHHVVTYRELEKVSRDTGFRAGYFVAKHVREKLKKRFTPLLGGFIASAFENAPALLHQLNSAGVLLTKTPVPA